MNNDMSVSELIDFVEKMEETRARARAAKKRYNEAAPADKIEHLAQLIYTSTHVDPHGYPNNLPDWDSLPVHTTTGPGDPDKIRYRNAAMAIMYLLDACD